MSGDSNLTGLPIDNVNTTPTIPLTDIAKQRTTELADMLAQASRQGYVEANFGMRILELAQQLVPLLTKG